MNDVDSTEKRKKRLKLYYGLLVTILCIIGVSYAWFRLYLSQSEDNTLASRTCFSTTLTEDTSKISLTDAFPISDEDGLKQTPFTFTLKNNCDSYVKVYITIDSTYRENSDTTYLKDDYLKVNVSSKDTIDNVSVKLGNQTLTDLENNQKGYIIVNTGLNSNEEKSYDLRIWMDSSTTLDQGLNKNWAGKIVAVSNASNLPSAPDGWYEAEDGTLLASIRDNNELKSPLTIPGREVSAHVLDDAESVTTTISSVYQNYYVTYGTGWKINGDKFNLTGTTVTSDTYANSYSSLVGKYLASISQYDFISNADDELPQTTDLDTIYYVVSATSSGFTYKPLSSTKNITEALLASTEDDYGTSYYFRGAVKNNYIQFANKCWRIVRVNGNGTIKLVLHNNNVKSLTPAQSIGTVPSSPCSSANNDDSAAFAIYTGKTYTSAFNSNYKDNVGVGFMYGATGASDYASAHANTNKSTILTNLETWYKNSLSSYETKLADTIWCNDKSTFSAFSDGTIWGTGLGYGTNQTGYGASNRIYDNGISNLICPNDNNGGKLSKFTVDDTTNGNGNLTYKIGLLTMDEIAFAGSTGSVYNSSTYLQENTGGNYWWAMSPNVFMDNLATTYSINVGELVGRISSVDDGLRPAISLVSDITISGGSGTSEDPYVIN